MVFFSVYGETYPWVIFSCLLYKMSDGVGTVYSGAAEFGRISAIISGVIGTLIALIIGGLGIYIIVEASRRTKSVTGTITESNCGNITPDKSEGTSCEITVEYTNKQPSNMCMKKFSVPDRGAFEKGKKVTIFYDPSDPCGSGSLETRTDDSILGIMLIVTAVVFIIIVWLVVWLTQRYKFFAAAEGVATVVTII